MLCKHIDQNDALLQWATASEINSDHFEVEVMDEQHAAFREIGNVKSSGTTVTSHCYNFVDTEENKNGIRYYRIKEVDAMGKTAYSQMRKVVFENDLFLISELYPDPAHDFTFLKVNASEEIKFSVTVIGNEGRIVSQNELLLSAGSNELLFNLSAYQNGLYTLLITDTESGKTYSRKLLKM